MRTAGQILREEREKKFYTLDEIEKATKIRKDFLQFLEDDNYSKLPPPTFVQGFIKNYSKFLKLDSEKLLAIYRREFSDRKNPPKILDSFVNPINRKRLNLTPARVISGLVLTILIAFFLYLWFEYRFLVGAPYLEITEPKDQTKVDNSVIRIVGRTNPEAKVEINNQQVTVDAAGNFEQELNLSESVNVITVISTSKSGKVAKEEKTVFLKK